MPSLPPYDALLLLSFGGPEQPADVLPFLENVTRGRNIPRERLLQVAEHYHHFGGRSPINDQNRRLIADLRRELADHGLRLPLYWGNRNWHPFLADTLRQMAADGVRQSLAFVTSAFGSYSGCRQYLNDIERARAAVGAAAPRIDKLRTFGNHPGFIAAQTEQVRHALDQLPPEQRADASLLFTAHSVPQAMADASPYVAQLRDACALVAQAVGRANWDLVYQSRSGPPTQPWLEPDVLDVLRSRHSVDNRAPVVLVPIGFLSDHMEVLYDLDTEARTLCDALPLPMVRAGTVATRPEFVTMIRELITERLAPGAPRRALGLLGPSADVCPADCCPAPQRPTRPAD